MLLPAVSAAKSGPDVKRGCMSSCRWRWRAVFKCVVLLLLLPNSRGSDTEISTINRRSNQVIIHHHHISLSSAYILSSLKPPAAVAAPVASYNY